MIVNSGDIVLYTGFFTHEWDIERMDWPPAAGATMGRTSVLSRADHATAHAARMVGEGRRDKVAVAWVARSPGDLITGAA